MGDEEYHDQESRKSAHALRKILVTANLGGIVTLGAFAGNLADKINPNWIIWPVGFFAIGAVIGLGSFEVAKGKERKRAEAAARREREPTFNRIWERNWVWTFCATISFVFGLISTLYCFQQIN